MRRVCRVDMSIIAMILILEIKLYDSFQMSPQTFNGIYMIVPPESDLKPTDPRCKL